MNKPTMAQYDKVLREQGLGSLPDKTISEEEALDSFECSNCKEPLVDEWGYCPICGYAVDVEIKDDISFTKKIRNIKIVRKKQQDGISQLIKQRGL